MTDISSLLVTNEYWYVDPRGNNHLVFATSCRIAGEYAKAKGFDLKLSSPPTSISPVSIHNANIWYQRVLFSTGE